MAFSELQREYLNKADKRWNFKTGATRSGKTYLDLFVIPKRIRARKGLPGLVVIMGVTKSTITRNVIEPLQEVWGNDLVGNIRSSDNTCYMFGEKVYCLGAEHIGQVSKLRGSSIKYLYGDEVADWNKDVFSLAKSRLDKPYSCFDGSLNPQGPRHWLKPFLDNKDGKVDVYTQKYTIFDNPFLDPSVVQAMCNEYEGSVFYKRYILGEWALAEGLVYPMLDEQKNVIKQKWTGVKQNCRYIVSIDYGTVNPFAGEIWEIDTGKNEVRMVKEFGWNGKELGRRDNEFYYEMMDNILTKYKIPVEYIVIDPSASGFIETINAHRKYRARAAINDVLDGIQCVTKCINSGILKIHSDCENTLTEFEQYSWDEKSEKEQVIKECDHYMDAMRYALMDITHTWLIGG